MAERDEDGTPDTRLPDDLRDPELLIDLLRRAGWRFTAWESDYQLFTPPGESSWDDSSVRVPLDREAPDFDRLMDHALDRLNRYGHIWQRLAAAAATLSPAGETPQTAAEDTSGTVAASTPEERPPYSDQELAELADLYDPELEYARATYMEGPMSGNVFAPGHTWDGVESTEEERLARLPDTARAAQELATAEQMRAIAAEQNASAAGLEMQDLAESLGGSLVIFGESREVTHLTTDLRWFWRDLAEALAPPLNVDGIGGVRMVLDEIKDTRADLHEAVTSCAADLHRRTDRLARAAAHDHADPSSTGATLTASLHAAIDDWASHRHGLAEARVGQIWAIVCHHALKARETLHAVEAGADADRSAGGPAPTDTHGVPGGLLSAPAQQLIDRTSQVGTPRAANRRAASAKSADRDPWASLQPPGRSVSVPGHRPGGGRPSRGDGGSGIA